MAETQELKERLKRATVCVYLAAEESVAADLSDILKQALSRINALEEGLRPFAEAMKWISDDDEDDYQPDWSPFIPVKHYRAAAALLTQEDRDRG